MNKKIRESEGMIMYIPTFWAGVLAVISAEIIAFIAVTVYAVIKTGKKDDKEEKQK